MTILLYGRFTSKLLTKYDQILTEYDQMRIPEYLRCSGK